MNMPDRVYVSYAMWRRNTWEPQRRTAFMSLDDAEVGCEEYLRADRAILLSELREWFESRIACKQQSIKTSTGDDRLMFITEAEQLAQCLVDLCPPEGNQ